MININELRRLAQAATPHVGHACKYQDAHWLREGHVDFENADLFIASERPQEDAKSDALEQARLNGMGASREAALMAKLEVDEKERDYLQARIEAMEKQEPVGQFIQHQSNGLWEQDGYSDNPDAKPLYLAPGAKGEIK